MRILHVLSVLLLGAAIMGSAGKAEAATRIQKTFGDWLVACVQPDEGEDTRGNCTLQQRFTGQTGDNGNSNNTNNRIFVFSVSVTVNDNEQEVIIIRTPLNIDLAKGVNIRFDNEDQRTISLDVCNRRGCFTESPIDASWTEPFSGFKAAEVSYAVYNGDFVNIDMDLTGFSDAYEFYKTTLAQSRL